MACDKINISGLSVNTYIGVYDWEQKILQNLLINLEFPIDAHNCEDDIKNTVDYAEICNQTKLFIESRSFNLIETVAHELAIHIKKKFNLASITISVSKPSAVSYAKNIKITIMR